MEREFQRQKIVHALGFLCSKHSDCCLEEKVQSVLNESNIFNENMSHYELFGFVRFP